MPPIKVDPSQKKAVAALLVVLAVVLGITAYRICSVRAARADVAAVAGPSDVAGSRGLDEVAQRPGRNPFRKPAAVQVGMAVVSVEPGAARTGDWASGSVPPMDIGRGPLMSPSEISVTEGGPGVTPASDTTAQDAEQPAFTLMTTVISPGKSLAVLRIGDSEIKVVRVGDMVDGRFRLQGLRPDSAELTDGVVTVTAKRGHTEDARTTEL